jgi:protein TonB
VGGAVTQANQITKVQPVYPALAKQARIQGIVVLEAEISREGLIENLRVVSGHPLLTQAAIDAVKQWTYKPTMLNGEPVPVVTTVTVNFSFAQ